MTKGERNKDKVKIKSKRGRETKIGRENTFKLEHTNRGSKLMNHLLHLNVH